MHSDAVPDGHCRGAFSVHNCPICGAPDDDYVVTPVTSESTGRCCLIDTCYCANCECDWEVYHRPSTLDDMLAGVDFALLAPHEASGRRIDEGLEDFSVAHSVRR